MSEEKGFGYESPEKQKKSAARLLTIELTVLTVVLIGIVVALNYLGIIPLYRVAPGLFGWLPVREGIQRGVALNPNEPILTGDPIPPPDLSKVSKSISAVSDNPQEFRVRIINEQELVQLLDSWKVFEQVVKINTAGQKGGSTPLVIHVTTLPQAGGRIFDENGDIATSLAIDTSRPESFDIFVHINPEKYKTQGEQSDILQFQILSHLYRLTHGVQSEEQSDVRESTMINELQNINNTSGRLFLVEKL